MNYSNGDELDVLASALAGISRSKKTLVEEEAHIVVETHKAMERLFDDKAVDVLPIRWNPDMLSAYVNVEGVDVISKSPNILAHAIQLADNFEIYENNGKVRISLAFCRVYKVVKNEL